MELGKSTKGNESMMEYNGVSRKGVKINSSFNQDQCMKRNEKMDRKYIGVRK